MKHWEEIRYYAPKTTAASSTFIIGWIFIIKNFSSWVTAAEYFGPAQATKNGVYVRVCVCTVSICLCMRVHKCLLAMLSADADMQNTRFGSSCVRLFIVHTHTHSSHIHTCTHYKLLGWNWKYMRYMYNKPWILVIQCTITPFNPFTSTWQDHIHGNSGTKKH